MAETQRQKLLVLETSGRGFGAALAEAAGPRFELKGEVFLDIGLRHSEVLKPSCEYLLNAAGWKKEELTHCGVSIGPGSFTGLRVGLAFARALCQGLGIPLVGVPTLEVIARGVAAHGRRTLCVLVDSIGDQVYAGLFSLPERRRLKPDRVLSVSALARELRPRARAGVLFAGDGFQSREGDIRRLLGNEAVKSLPPEKGVPKARDLARLAWERIQKRRPAPGSWRNVVPLYMREPMAVERLRKKSAR